MGGGWRQGGGGPPGPTAPPPPPPPPHRHQQPTQRCDARLEDCDVSSSTGGGVGVEGGAPHLLGCAVHDCARHGVALFGDLMGGGCAARLQRCTLSDNRMNGLLVRDGAAPTDQECMLTGNRGWGLQLADCGGRCARVGGAWALARVGVRGCSRGCGRGVGCVGARFPPPPAPHASTPPKQGVSAPFYRPHPPPPPPRACMQL